MPNNELKDWQKIVIMACTPYMGNRAVSNRANCSVWAVRKYRNRMKDKGESLDIDVGPEDILDEEPEDGTRVTMVSEEGMEILDEIVQEALNQNRGKI